MVLGSMQGIQKVKTELTVNPVKNLARYFSKFAQPCDRDKTVSRCIILWARGSTIAEGGGYKYCDQYSQQKSTIRK